VNTNGTPGYISAEAVPSDEEQIERQRDLIGSWIRDREATPDEIRIHRALTDYLSGKIDRWRLAHWLSRIESGDDTQ
jgi:hypothetical protein